MKIDFGYKWAVCGGAHTEGYNLSTFTVCRNVRTLRIRLTHMLFVSVRSKAIYILTILTPTFVLVNYLPTILSLMRLKSNKFEMFGPNAAVAMIL